MIAGRTSKFRRRAESAGASSTASTARKSGSFDTYRDIPLKAARERRDEAREVLAAGIDPDEQRKAMKWASEERALGLRGDLPGVAGEMAHHGRAYPLPETDGPARKECLPVTGGAPDCRDIRT